MLSDETEFPFGFVMVRDKTNTYELTDQGKPKKLGTIKRRTFVHNERSSTANGRRQRTLVIDECVP